MVARRAIAKLGALVGAAAWAAGAAHFAAAESNLPPPKCTLNCITVFQHIDEQEAVAWFPLKCDSTGMRCAGEGTLRIFDELMPVATMAIVAHGGVHLRLSAKSGHFGGKFQYLRIAPNGTSTDITLSTLIRVPNDARPMPGNAAYIGRIPGKIRIVIRNYRVESGLHSL